MNNEIWIKYLGFTRRLVWDGARYVLISRGVNTFASPEELQDCMKTSGWVLTDPPNNAWEYGLHK
jgi:hypothetical protein